MLKNLSAAAEVKKLPEPVRNRKRGERSTFLLAPAATEVLSLAPYRRRLQGRGWRNLQIALRPASLDRVQVFSQTWEVMRPLCGQSLKVNDRQSFLSAASKTKRRAGLPAFSPAYGFDSSIVNLERQKHCFSFFKGWKLKERCLGNETAFWKKKMSMFERAGSEAKWKPW